MIPSDPMTSKDGDQPSGSATCGSQTPRPSGVDPSAKPAIPARFDPSGPLFTPEFLVDEGGDVPVLLDTQRAHWIGVNRLGLGLMQRIAKSEEVSETELDDKPLRRFLKSAARRGFLGNTPFPPITRRNRREAMAPKKLHEMWIVTNDHCNLRCRHCYTIERVKEGRTGISGDALKAIIQEAHQLGAEVFYFTGGEPTLRDDFLDLARFVMERAKLILFTNGITITEALAADLAPYRDRLVVQVSIEGPDEAVNTPVRGKGSYTRAMEGIRNLLEKGIRVGVSTTPTGISKDRISEITEQLAEMERQGHQVEYHHLILLLERGGAKDHADIGALSDEDLDSVLGRSIAAIRQAKRANRSTRLQLTNDKIFHALATHGPAKDFCGAGYTILGVSADGKLLPCAACMDDERYFMGDLLDDHGGYEQGRLRDLWMESDAVERIRRFSLAPADGAPVKDLRYFHGGGCWKNMDDPEVPFHEGHPFAGFYERQMLEAIRKAASEHVELEERVPEVVSFMHAARIACAGERKNTGDGEVDQGHCICFA